MRPTNVTPDLVRGIKPDFKQFDDAYINRVIQRAQVSSVGDGLDNAYGVNDDDQMQIIFDDGVLNYARHILALDIFMKYNGVTAATVMNNSQTITDKTANDPYLSEYNRLVNLYGTSMLQKGAAIFYEY